MALDAKKVFAMLGDKADLVNGKVPADQLPSYVDDVVEYANRSAFPATGEAGKIYVAIDTNKTYRWTGSTYVEIGGGGGSTNTYIANITLAAGDESYTVTGPDFDDIVAAHNAGKAIIAAANLTEDGSSVLTGYGECSCYTSEACWFDIPIESSFTIIRVKCSKSGSTTTWAYEGYHEKENANNKITTWSATPSNQKYPSESLVKGTLNEKISKPSGGSAGNVLKKTANGETWGSVTAEEATYDSTLTTHTTGSVGAALASQSEQIVTLDAKLSSKAASASDVGKFAKVKTVDAQTGKVSEWEFGEGSWATIFPQIESDTTPYDPTDEIIYKANQIGYGTSDVDSKLDSLSNATGIIYENTNVKQALDGKCDSDRVIAEMMSRSQTSDSSIVVPDYISTEPQVSSDAGLKGQIYIGTDYVYICVEANTWKRFAITTF